MALEFVRPTYSPVKSVNGMTGDVVVVIPEADLTGYATEAYVDKKVAEAATGGEINLDGYATKVELQKAIEEIELTPGPQGEPGKDGQDGKDYVLTEEDKAEIAGMVDVSGADVDLTDYYTKGEVDAAIEQIELTPGPQGPAGQDGYTPVKGVDYFDGKDGQDGAPGADGQDYVLTEEDKAEIAAMVDVSGGDSCPITSGTGTNSVMTPTATKADGTGSVAIGDMAIAYGHNSIAMNGGVTAGTNTVAIGQGAATPLDANASTAIGRGTLTGKISQVAIGQYNSATDTSLTFIVGSGADEYSRRNAMTVNVDNQVHFPGSVVVGENKDEVATKAYVDEAVAAGGGGSSDAEQISVIIDVLSYSSYTNEELNAIMALWNYYEEHGTVNPNVTIKASYSNLALDVIFEFQSGAGIMVYAVEPQTAAIYKKWYHIEEGSVVTGHIYTEKMSMQAGKDWVWINANPSNTAIAIYGALSSTTATQIKFVGYWDDDTKYETLEYSSHDGRYAWGYEGYEPQCYVYSPQKKQTYHFKNGYGSFELYSETNTNVMGTEFHCIGCYIFK